MEKPLCPFADPAVLLDQHFLAAECDLGIRTELSGGDTKLDVRLNNAAAAMAIGAFLRRLRKEGRNPDRWEVEQTVRAMAFLALGRYRQAIDHVGRALIPPSKRDPAAVIGLEKATGHLVVPDLATLQGILDEICDGGGALAHWMGNPAGPEPGNASRG